MRRYFVELCYKGTGYHGWQIQPNAITVQETLEVAFSLLLKEKIKIVGAGRTDTGVHATFYTAHFDCNKGIVDSNELVFKLNRFLKNDISIYKIFNVANDKHARFSAKSRTYEYRVITRKNPFLDDYSYFLYGNIDFSKMNEAAKILFEYEDFTSFSKLHTDTKTNYCKICKAEWIQRGEQHIFIIKADRFLRNMVRAVVGTLLDIGFGKIDITDFRKVIESKNRNKAGFSVPAKALFLTDIQY